MNKGELESKHLSELHALAADAGVPRYRMLRREELIEKLLDGKPPGEKKRRPRETREERDAPVRTKPRERSAPEQAQPLQPPPPPPAESSRPPRRRRRRRFGRREKGVRPQDLLLPPPGRQALVFGESPEACTSMLREIAAELAGASKGPDSIALLVDPSPEELAEWKREAPDAEIVAAGKARHAADALGQAVRRAEGGDDVILLVDSLTKIEDDETAKEIFDGGLDLRSAQGSLTVVAALERTSS